MSDDAARFIDNTVSFNTLDVCAWCRAPLAPAQDTLAAGAAGLRLVLSGAAVYHASCLVERDDAQTQNALAWWTPRLDAARHTHAVVELYRHFHRNPRQSSAVSILGGSMGSSRAGDGKPFVLAEDGFLALGDFDSTTGGVPVPRMVPPGALLGADAVVSVCLRMPEDTTIQRHRHATSDLHEHLALVAGACWDELTDDADRSLWVHVTSNQQLDDVVSFEIGLADAHGLAARCDATAAMHHALPWTTLFDLFSGKCEALLAYREQLEQRVEQLLVRTVHLFALTTFSVPELDVQVRMRWHTSYDAPSGLLLIGGQPARDARIVSRTGADVGCSTTRQGSPAYLAMRAEFVARSLASLETFTKTDCEAYGGDTGGPARHPVEFIFA